MDDRTMTEQESRTRRDDVPTWRPPPMSFDETPRRHSRYPLAVAEMVVISPSDARWDP
jgi:hypothetical protein